MEAVKNNIPELRLPEFEQKWEKVKLKNVSTYFNGGSFENDVQEKGKYELVTLKSINVNGNLVHSNRFVDIEVPTLSKNTLVMILSEQAPGLLGMTTLIPIDNKYVLNQRVAEIRPKDNVESYFLSMAINRNQRYFSKHGAGTKVQNISKPNVENYEFLCPSLPEQQKIANFLSSVDTKIEQLTKKKQLLEQYKKGVMQQIFSQQLRFKNENGNDYPDWEEKKLGEIANITTGSSNRVDSGLDGKYTFFDRSEDIRTSNIFLFDGEAIIVAGEGSDFVPKYFIGKFDLHQRTYSIMDFRNANGKFLFFYIHFFRRYFLSQAVGSTVKSLRLPMFQKMKIQLPCLEEQSQIATFLRSIDKKIDLVNTQLENTQAFKKGLLQQMFV
jgi:type I restriction enzyme S subunit